jgi:outer membrane protein OmpA-like peptidoglycan-associated protein
MKKIIVTLLLLPTILFSQEKKLQKADSLFNKQEYIDAIKIYKSCIDNGNQNPVILEKIANAYYNNASYIEANTWYTKLYDKSPKMKGEYHYRYAQTLKSVGLLDQSKAQLELYRNASPNEIRAKNSLHSSSTESDFLFSNIKNLNFNTRSSDYGSVLKGDTLIFSSAINHFSDNGKYKRTNQAFSSLFKTIRQKDGNYSKSKLFSKKVYSIFHESKPVFTNDGKTMYYTQNQFVEKSNHKLSNGGFKIYRSTFQDGKWKNNKLVSFGENSDINCAHPALSPDGKYIYFSSNMSGAVGSSDLYRALINTDGTFGKAEHLGNEVNTEGRETFPFITQNNILIFASDGREGFGGLDLYYIDLNNLKQGVINMGSSINSPFDDFDLVLDSNKNIGFYTSNKPGGKGDDDIYSFDFTIRPKNKKLQLLELKGIVKDNQEEIIPNSKLVLVDKNKIEISKTFSDSKGFFVFNNLIPNSEYSILVSKDNYIPSEEFIKFEEDNKEVVLKINKNEISLKQGDDLNKLLQIEKIYFDTGKYVLKSDAITELNKVVNFMIKYTDVSIEIGSHTDCRDKSESNLILSQKRAEATLNYLVKQGISPSRLKAKGYGETKPLNECVDGIKCSEDKYQTNRRSEFIITKL